ncbi:hypothetical protein WJX72_005207 [[Myrmecia] bisecta]|uniref:Glycosyl transferase family 1 domain-containing protein n=1 Tax=[Myrmecia] bisecta TaxID=41462 RepID=A0AAW1QF36_9CHLO
MERLDERWALQHGSVHPDEGVASNGLSDRRTVGQPSAHLPCGLQAGARKGSSLQVALEPSCGMAFHSGPHHNGKETCGNGSCQFHRSRGVCWMGHAHRRSLAAKRSWSMKAICCLALCSSLLSGSVQASPHADQQLDQHPAQSLQNAMPADTSASNLALQASAAGLAVQGHALLEGSQSGLASILPPLPQAEAACQGAACPCSVIVVSNYPPKKNGMATYTKAWTHSLQAYADFAATCTVRVLAVLEPDEEPTISYTDPIIAYTLKVDHRSPSNRFMEAALYINKGGFTHVVIQQEFSLTPLMWQLADLARWINPQVAVYTVIHTPRAYPNVEERGIVRQFAKYSKYLIVMSWHAQHSLVAAYGISPAKVVFIPHGVQTEHEVKRNDKALAGFEALAGLGNDDLVILSNGLIHRHKGLERIVRNMPALVKRFPRLFFVIVGREHSAVSDSGKVMPRLLDLASSLGVGQHIMWVNRFVNSEELSALFARATLYVTMFDDIAPTSGTLLAAMSLGMPIVSTPYRFALEVLADNRGCIVPFEDDSELAASIIRVLSSAQLRQEMGAAARAFAHRWSWPQVAKRYGDLLVRDQYEPLTPDPYSSSSQVFSASWSDSRVETFHKQSWALTLGGAEPGCYVLFCDNDVQVNAMLTATAQLAAVGVRTNRFWVLMHSAHGIDFEFNPSVSESERSLGKDLIVDMRNQTIVVHTANGAVMLNLRSNGAIVLHIDMGTRFAHPLGVLGQTFRSQQDLSYSVSVQGLDSVNWRNWHVPSGFLFSHEAVGQSWSGLGINANVLYQHYDDLPPLTFENTPVEKVRQMNAIQLQLEGPLFDPSGFAVVNRRIWFQLQRDMDAAAPVAWPKIAVMLQPHNGEGADTANSFDSVLSYLIYHEYMRQSQSLQTIAPDVVFRNAWPPNLVRPPPSAVWIHQQPWEFEGIPKEWVQPLNDADEIWVPSQYNKDSYTRNGVKESAIRVVRHGIENTKFDVLVDTYNLPTKKSFRILFNGGMLPRKGIDVLLTAYSKEFTPDDDVVLVIHSVYGDEFKVHQIFAMQKDPRAPEVIFLREEMSELNLTSLYKSASVYVSPYRSEGFGITVLEAMACGIPVVVTGFGPSLELCTDSVCSFIQSSPAACLLPPCGDMTVFGKPTVLQPAWVEPSAASLARQLRTAYNNRTAQNALRKTIIKHSRKFGWHEVGNLMLERLYSLVAEKRADMRGTAATAL